MSSGFSRLNGLVVLSSAKQAAAFLWLGLSVCTGVAIAEPLSYEDARVALHSVSDLQKAGESNVRRSEYEARAADNLRLPELSVNATEIFGLKTGTLDTPLGPIDIHDDFTGPRSSIDSIWSIYTGGRIAATQR